MLQYLAAILGSVFPYFYGSGQVGFLLAEVEETGDCYSIRQVVDKGHVVDQVVCLSDAKDDDCGDALQGEKKGLNAMRIVINGCRVFSTCVPSVVYRTRAVLSTHADQQGRDGSTVFKVDHRQEIGQVTLSGP